MSEGFTIPASLPPGGATGGSTIASLEIIPSETILEAEIKDPILPLFEMGSHQRMENFTGREDVLASIDRHLLPSESASSPKQRGARQFGTESSSSFRSFAICGLGGIGKTTLAVEYAYSRKDKFEVIYWLSADDANLLASNFAQIPQRLGLEDESSDFAASRDVAMGWLSRPLRKTAEPESPGNFADWLLIYDNVDNLDVLSEYWPRLGRGSVLVTSRDPSAKHNLYTRDGLDLSPLSLTDSELLLQRLTQSEADHVQRRALEEISQKLDGLPLAISQMSGVFRRLRLSYNDFLKYYDEEGIEELFKKQTKVAGESQASSLATLWSLDRLSSSTKALLQVICFLDPDDIPEELLIDKAAGTSLANYPKSRGHYYDARLELVSSSLIGQNVQQEKLFLHRLVQDTIKSMMTREELISAFQSATSLVLDAWPFQSLKEHHSVARFSRCEVTFPSVLRLRNNMEILVEKYPDFPLDMRLARLFNDAGW